MSRSKKATTAAIYERPTKVFEDAIAQGGVGNNRPSASAAVLAVHSLRKPDRRSMPAFRVVCPGTGPTHWS